MPSSGLFDWWISRLLSAMQVRFYGFLSDPIPVRDLNRCGEVFVDAFVNWNVETPNSSDSLLPLSTIEPFRPTTKWGIDSKMNPNGQVEIDFDSNYQLDQCKTGLVNH